MPTQLLSVGYVQPVVQNQVFALPSRRVLMFTPDAGVTYFQSNTVDFAVSVAVTLANGEAELAGGFLRCTSAAPTTITLKPV